jgi:hypothetical protein
MIAMIAFCTANEEAYLLADVEKHLSLGFPENAKRSAFCFSLENDQIKIAIMN